MTMARINNHAEVVEVGVPARLDSVPAKELQKKGWRPVKGSAKPINPTAGMRYVYGAPYTYSAEEDAVYGSWKEQPIPAMTLEMKREKAALTRAEFKLSLQKMGELENVKAAMADPDADPRAQILWEDAMEFRRTHPDLLTLANTLGYTDAQLDALFGVTT